MLIDKIWSSDVKDYKTDAIDGEHLKLRRLNLLIGPNNSGKSRLLRSLFATPLKNMSVGLGSEFHNACRSLGPLFDIFSERKPIFEFMADEFMDLYDGHCKTTGAIDTLLNSLRKLVTDAANVNLSFSGGDLRAYYQVQDVVRSEYPAEALNDLNSAIRSATDLRRHYIPILRGMRPLQDGTDLFLERTLKDYFATGGKTDLKIVTGFDLYKLLAQFLLGQPEERQRIRRYEKILGNEFFGGQEITLIPQYGKDTVAVKIGEDDQFPIYDLGDGLQQVIIITSAAYLEQERSVFLLRSRKHAFTLGCYESLRFFY